MDDARRTYLVACVMDWIVVGVLAWGAVQWLDLAPWVGTLIVLAWIIKDGLMYPSMRRYYESLPAPRRMVGEEGSALCRIDPRGFARVHGEIWQVHIPPHHAPVNGGARIRVRDIQGMDLLVEVVAEPASREAAPHVE